ncbi:MAG: hypothetical protein AAGH64_05320 [Planctomycetota bacterium]
MHLMPFLSVLLGWSVLWCAAAILALWLTDGRTATRGFFFMSGLWACVNAGIVAFSLVNPPDDSAELARLLLINAALDVGYLAIGLVMLTRKKPVLKGFGAAIILQGLFLLVFDLVWKSML